MRAFQRAAQAVSRESAPKLTVITYNILGDGEKLALSKKHDYCARELRLWASRCPRLVAEISGYGAGVVGLQECSARMFRDLTAGLSYGLPPGKLDQPESQPGLAGYHWADFVAADSKDEALASDTGLAAFVRTDTWKTVAVHARFLRELLFGSRVSGRLRKKLKTQSDAVLLLLLEHRPTQRRVLVANCHLYWDPHFPHVKVAQAELVTTAINHFAVECRQRSGVAAAAAASADAPADAAPPPPALVLCGDFNSTPHHQPGFLPEVQRAQTPPPPAASHSAVYELLSTGTLAPQHPEHPDSFGMASPPGSSGDAHDAKRAKTDGVGPLVAPTGALVDAYRDALAPGPLPLSTHADDFAGTLDYIWHGGAGGEWAPTEVVEVLGMPYALGDAAAFPSIPDAQWPSDHLALGAVLQLA